jgi:hypothetical protein
VLHAPAHFLAKSKPERALRVWLGYWRLSLGFSVWFGNWSVVLLKPVTVEEEKVKTVSVEPLEFRQKNGDVRLTLGNIQLILPVSPDQTVKHPFKDFLGSRMLLTVEDGKMWCDVRYAAAFGMPQMKLERNALIGLPSEWDCNSSDRALEIVNEKLVPIFQIYYKNDFHIVLKGAVINTNTLALTTDTNTTFIRNVKLSREETMTLIEGLKLKRIFKYPSWKYPRQFEENPN